MYVFGIINQISYCVSGAQNHVSNGFSREWQVLKTVLEETSADVKLGREFFYFLPECTQDLVIGKLEVFFQCRSNVLCFFFLSRTPWKNGSDWELAALQIILYVFEIFVSHY